MAQEQTKQFIEQATQNIQSGQFEQALQLLDQALAGEPESSDAHLLRAICLSQLNKPSDATAAFHQVIVISPQNSKARYNFAVHLYGQGQKAEALEQANAAVALEPGHAAAQNLVDRISAEIHGTPVSSSDEAAPVQPPRVAPPVEYPRPVFSDSAIPPSHSLPFVENMGSGWVVLGWILVLIDLAAFIFAIVLVIPVLSSMTGGGDPTAMQEKLAHVPGMSLVQIMGWVSKILIVFWTALDLVDRRGNYLWLIPNVVCVCCGFGWLTLPIYMLAGRNK